MPFTYLEGARATRNQYSNIEEYEMEIINNRIRKLFQMKVHLWIVVWRWTTAQA